MSKKISTRDEAVAAFIEGAKIKNTGLYLDDKKMVKRGLMRADEGVRYLDRQGPNTRDMLVALLDHDDDGVRVVAAGAVFRSHQDLALSVIRKIADESVTQAYMSASLILIFEEVFGYFAFGIWDDPRYPMPAEAVATS